MNDRRTSAAEPDALVRPVRGPWGFWTTIGLSAAAVAGWVAVQIAAPVFGRVSGAYSAGSVSVALWTGFPVGIALVWLFARLRRAPTAAAYLAIVPVRARTVGFWLAAFGAYLALTELVKLAFGFPSIPPNIVAAYAADPSPVLFLLAVAIAAPAFEELLFRGFMFRGLAASSAGSWGAIVLTTLVWGGLHFDYPAHELPIILGAGVLLGLARWKTGSLIPPLAAHAALNVLASIQIAVAAG